MLYATLVECLFHLFLEYLCDSLKRHACACFNLDKPTCQCICIVLCFVNACVNVTSTLQDITKKKKEKKMGLGAFPLSLDIWLASLHYSLHCSSSLH